MNEGLGVDRSGHVVGLYFLLCRIGKGVTSGWHYFVLLLLKVILAKERVLAGLGMDKSGHVVGLEVRGLLSSPVLHR